MTAIPRPQREQPRLLPFNFPDQIGRGRLRLSVDRDHFSLDTVARATWTCTASHTVIGFDHRSEGVHAGLVVGTAAVCFALRFSGIHEGLLRAGIDERGGQESALAACVRSTGEAVAQAVLREVRLQLERPAARGLSSLPSEAVGLVAIELENVEHAAASGVDFRAVARAIGIIPARRRPSRDASALVDELHYASPRFEDRFFASAGARERSNIDRARLEMHEEIRNWALRQVMEQMAIATPAPVIMGTDVADALAYGLSPIAMLQREIGERQAGGLPPQRGRLHRASVTPNPAVEKARATLRSSLSPDQLAQFDVDQTFTVAVPGRGSFRVLPRSAFSVRHVESGDSYCVQLAAEAGCPIFDQMLATKILLEIEPARFFATANVQRASTGRIEAGGRHPGWAGFAALYNDRGLFNSSIGL